MFVILALPRSRTKWLSAFLTYGTVTCHHEYVSTLDSLDDIRGLGDDGTAETFGTLVWRQLYDRIPDARWLIVRRPIREVEDSVRRQGFSAPIMRCARMLDAAEKVIPAMVVNFSSINDSLTDIWRHCRGDEMPAGRESMAGQNISESIAAQVARVDPIKLRAMICSR